jgi:HEAT repeat protein
VFRLAPLPRTLGAALRDARDKKPAVRISALKDLARHADGEERADAVVALEKALSDRSPKVRAEAALSIADAGAAECLGALFAAAGDREESVRQMALLAIGEMSPVGDAEACRVIAGSLGAEVAALRFQALIAWNRIAPDRAMEANERALRDDDAKVRHIAIRLAEERWMGESGLDAVAAATWARAHGDHALGVPVAAAIVLGRGGSAAGRRALVEAVECPGSGLDPEDEQTALELVGKLGIEEARPGLAHRAFGGLGGPKDAFAWQARVALARLGDGRARSAILDGLAAWTRDSRTLAVIAAGHAGLEEARAQIESMRGDARRAEPSAVDEALRLLAADGSGAVP